MKKVLFISGTRADYGKIKSILKTLEKTDGFELHIYVCGMHLLEEYGGTYREIIKDGYKNIHIARELKVGNDMAFNIADLIFNLNEFVHKNSFDLIVVHGDRTDALGGAIVGALNNIRVAHIEGGEISGTIDDSLRHAISKLAHFHFVSNVDAKNRLIQMGEDNSRIFVIGSPDIDLMFSDNLPSLESTKQKYDIQFEKYAILMFHPVTTEFESFKLYSKNLVDACLESDDNYIVVYPNNDIGNEFILEQYERLKNNERFKIYPSIRFENFLTLLKCCDFMIGNSSAGIRETTIYGIPSIDIGTRQSNRYNFEKCPNIIHCSYSKEDILKCILAKKQKYVSNYRFGNGNSAKMFLNVLRSDSFWSINIQKKFIDLE